MASIAPVECLLGAKIATFWAPDRRMKKGAVDANDLVFLLGLAAEKGLFLGYETVPGLGKKLVVSFWRTRPSSSEDLEAVGCSLEE
jgi:hypothetical protein